MRSFAMIGVFLAVAQDNMANILLAYKGNNNYTGPINAAQDIARRTASQLLKPLLETACSRLAFVIRRVFEIAADRTTQEGVHSLVTSLLTGCSQRPACGCVCVCLCGGARSCCLLEQGPIITVHCVDVGAGPEHWAACAGAAKDSLQPYIAFHAALHTAQVVFLNQLEAKARMMMSNHLEVATSKFAVRSPCCFHRSSKKLSELVGSRST
jgi:hypothetical protein